MDKRADGCSCYETNSTILSCLRIFLSHSILPSISFHTFIFDEYVKKSSQFSSSSYSLSALYPQSSVARSNRCTLSASRVCSVAPKHTNEKEPKEEDEEYLKVLNCVQRFHDIYFFSVCFSLWTDCTEAVVLVVGLSCATCSLWGTIVSASAPLCAEARQEKSHKRSILFIDKSEILKLIRIPLQNRWWAE